MKKCPLLIFILMLIIGSCKKESKKGSTKIDPIDTTNIAVRQNVHVIDSTTLKLNRDTALLNVGTYQFTERDNAVDYKIGDIIVGQTDEGYLRKITAINKNGKVVTYKTLPSVLTDAFKNGEIKCGISTSDIVPKNNSTAKIKINSTQSASSNTAIAFAKGSISLSGSLTFSPNLDFDVKISHGLVNYLNVGFTNAALTGTLNLSINGSQGVLLSGDEVIKEFTPKVTTVLLGEIPVVIVTRISVHAIYSFKIIQSVSKQITFTHTNRLSANILYDNGDLTFPHNESTSHTITFSPFTDNASLKTTLSIVPEIDMKVYGVLGPYFQFGVNAGVNGDLNVNTLDWNLGGSAWLSLTLGLNGSVFGYSFNTGNLTFNSKAITYKTPYSINSFSGDNQFADINKPVSQPLKIQILDTLNKPQARVPVYFKVISGGGILSQDAKGQRIASVKIFTDANGFAQTGWTLGESPNPQQVQATAMWADGTLLKKAPVTFTSNPKIKIGDKAFGGIVFYIDNTGKHGLVVDSLDLATNITPNTVTGCPSCTFINGDGKTNTQNIISTNYYTKNIALICVNYKGGGYNDWYLPAISELSLLYNVKTMIRGLGPNIYFSSSAGSPGQITLPVTKVIDFSGANIDGDVFPTGNVRAIRAF